MFAMRTMAALICAGWMMWAPAGMAGERTLYSDDGLSELSAPDAWRVRPDIGREAGLRVSDPDGKFHLTAYSYRPGEFEPATLAQFAAKFSADLAAKLADVRVSGPVELTLQGSPALQYQVTGRAGEDGLVYLSTTVEGASARYQLVATVAASEYPAAEGVLHKVIASFRESARPRPEKERIDLVFAWPQRVESRFTVRTLNTDRRGTRELQLSGLTAVRPQGDAALLVSTHVTDYSMKPAEADKDAAQQNYLQNLLQQATSGIPDYAVSRDGAFLRIENLDAYYGRLEQALLEGLPAGAEDSEARAKNLIQSMLSEQTLTTSIEGGWNRLVADWAGGSYAVGEDYTYEAAYQLATLGEASFPMTVSRRLTGRVPCRTTDKAATCVQLVATSRVAGPDFDRAMQQFLNQIVGKMVGNKAEAPVLSVEGAEIVKTVTLITDPDTLMPYEEKTTTVKTTPVSVNGKQQAGREVEESVTRYAY